MSIKSTPGNRIRAVLLDYQPGAPDGFQRLTIGCPFRLAYGTVEPSLDQKAGALCRGTLLANITGVCAPTH
jgi:hypothetical protein